MVEGTSGNNYESPEFYFQEMRLADKAIDRCHADYCFVDGDKDGVMKLPGTRYYFPSSGCPERRNCQLWGN